MKKSLGLLWVILLLAIDQITKYFAQLNLSDGTSIDIIPNVFSLQYLENTGAAFGIFKDRILFFLILTIVITIVLIIFYYKIPTSKRYVPMKVTIIFLIAGALGNFIDRFINHYVIDFLYFELIDFPIFNVADCYVSVATCFMIILLLWYYKEEDFAFLAKHSAVNSISETDDDMEVTDDTRYSENEDNIDE